MSNSQPVHFDLFGTTPITSLNQHSVDPRDFRVLQRIPLCSKEHLEADHIVEGLPFKTPLQLNTPEAGEEICTLIVLDTETTGLKIEEDEVIELGMVKATYAKKRHLLLSIEGVYAELNQPKKPLTRAITELTGITQQELTGKAFHLPEITEFMQATNLIIAHNAGFDRPFFEKTFPNLRNFNWACSLHEIDWINHFDMPSAKLGLMVREQGFFFDPHRAVNDCLALLWLLFINEQALQELLTHARETTYTLKVVGNSYAIKDELKEKFHARFRVRQNGGWEEKNWYLEECSEGTLQEFDRFLAAKRDAGCEVDYEKVGIWTAGNRYRA